MAAAAAVTQRGLFRALTIVGVALVVVVGLLSFTVWRSTGQHVEIDRVAGCRQRIAGADEFLTTHRDLDQQEAIRLALRASAINNQFRAEGDAPATSDPRHQQLRDILAAADRLNERVAAYDRRLPELADLRRHASDLCEENPDYRVPEHLTVLEP